MTIGHDILFETPEDGAEVFYVFYPHEGIGPTLGHGKFYKYEEFGGFVSKHGFCDIHDAPVWFYPDEMKEVLKDLVENIVRGES